ncbi:hypothetical protein MRB53_037605 [Persea americana]|nr:hypothetical protein MRB53_037605 [Persea americana]
MENLEDDDIEEDWSDNESLMNPTTVVTMKDTVSPRCLAVSSYASPYAGDHGRAFGPEEGIALLSVRRRLLS